MKNLRIVKGGGLSKLKNKFQSLEKKKQKRILAIFMLVITLCIGASYAFIRVTLAGEKKQVITAGSLELILEEDENNLTITNALPMHDEVGMIQDAFTFRLINNGNNTVNYILKLADITVGEKLDTSFVKYGLTKGDEVSIQLLSTLEDNKIDAGKISGKQTIEYSLRLWIDSGVEDNSLIKDKSLSYKVEVEVTQDLPEEIHELGLISEVPFAENNWGENCKTYDDGTDTFLVGKCSNNYVWYSGKLWRVVLKNNETGAVKLVTDNGITAIPRNQYNASGLFHNSPLDQWLQQDFLPTLHDYDDYLMIDSPWDESLNLSSTPTRLEETDIVNRTVGLLNSYEYYTVYSKSDGLSNTSDNYLNNGVNWWLTTSFHAENHSILQGGGGYVESTGALGKPYTGATVYNMIHGYSARPAVNVKPVIQVVSGKGTINSPYHLINDTQKIENGITLLNTRYSGEYIKFNNELYRIVLVEDGMTKIIAVDKPNELKSNTYSYGSGMTAFKGSKIKDDLEQYYQNLDNNTKKMVATDTKWYYGTIDMGDAYQRSSHYKRGICASVSDDISVHDCVKTGVATTANIGLPRAGEMFVSQITRGTKEPFWTLNPLDSSNGHSVTSTGNFIGTNSIPYSSAYGARPMLYLKNNVRISSNNNGDGTYEHPYSIEWYDFKINDGSGYTNNRHVLLNMGDMGISKMCISNSIECTNYESFSTTKEWDLSSGDGQKTVYVYYKDENDKVVAFFGGNIILDTTPPQNNSITISSEDGLKRTLTLSSEGADYVCISNNSSNIDDCKDWFKFESKHNWDLSSGAGDKKIYAFFKDKTGNISGPHSATTSCINDCNEYFIDAYGNYTIYLMRSDGATAKVGTSTNDVVWYTEGSQKMHSCSAANYSQSSYIWCIGEDNNIYYKTSSSQTNWVKKETDAIDLSKYRYFIYAAEEKGYLVREDGKINRISTSSTEVEDSTWSYGAAKDMAVCNGYGVPSVVCIGKDGYYYYQKGYNNKTDYLGGTIFRLFDRTRQNSWISTIHNSQTNIIESNNINIYNARFSNSDYSTIWYTSSMPGGGVTACTSSGSQDSGKTNYCLGNDGYLYYKGYQSTSWTKSSVKYK